MNFKGFIKVGAKTSSLVIVALILSKAACCLSAQLHGYSFFQQIYEWYDLSRILLDEMAIIVG